VVEQIRKRLAGEPIEDRLLSLFDPDARPIRKRTLGTTTELGSGEQLAEVTPTRKPGARGCIVAPASAPGNPGENEPLATTVQELQQLALRPREELAPLAPKRTFIAGRASPGSRRTQRRLARYRRRRGSELAPATPPPAPAQPPPRRRGRAQLHRLGAVLRQRRTVRTLRLSEAPGHQQEDRDAKAQPMLELLPPPTRSGLPRAFIREK